MKSESGKDRPDAKLQKFNCFDTTGKFRILREALEMKCLEANLIIFTYLLNDVFFRLMLANYLPLSLTKHKKG
ncbi:MAG: hypothetical protein RLZZ490_2396 [Cyanobacteriota bacterium]